MTIQKLAPRQLRRQIPARNLPFSSTDEIEPLTGVIGQDRAIKAIELALEMDHSGYNVFVTGMSGTGKTTIVENIVKKIAKGKPVPDDWVYVYNFEKPDSPRLIQLPAGRGREMAFVVEDLVRSLQKEIPATFSSEQYEQQKGVLLKHYSDQKNKLMDGLEEEAAAMNLQVESTPSGFQTVLLHDGEPLTSEEFDKFSKEEKDAMKDRLNIMQNKINGVVREFIKLDKTAKSELKKLNEKITGYIVSQLIEEVKPDFEDFPQILEYLDELSKDILKHLPQFLGFLEQSKQGAANRRANDQAFFKRYQVNVFVDHGRSKTVPVIYEPNPTYNNLFGRIEKQVVMGAQVTDFTMIKCGSLHQANGGYLITEAGHLLKNSLVYDALKRTIKTRQLRIEDISELYGYSNNATLRPESMPINLKVILLGWNRIYYMLQAYDQDFNKIFKIRADFDYESKSTPKNIFRYAQFIKRVCDQEKLQAFSREAVREVLYYAHRLVEDQKKMSLRFGTLVGILREANYFALKKAHEIVQAADVKKAISEREYRQSLAEEKSRDIYEREIFKIDTKGAVVGQINGLAVYSMGEFSFGKPSRITAKSFIGSESIINIERKARLSGKIHDKGLNILKGYFNDKFAQYMPLSFSASITFEQSYGMIDGDSASSTELYALLSSLSGIPIKQGIAVTGSVNQNGDVQAIGGVNQKIEGYFEICKKRGLTGEQGVMIPASNIDSLTLKDEVIAAVRKGKFYIWAVENIADGLSLLTGKTSGERGKNKKFKKNTVFGMVETRLRGFAKISADFRKSLDGKNKVRDGESDRKNGENNEDDQEESEKAFS